MNSLLPYKAKMKLIIYEKKNKPTNKGDTNGKRKWQDT